VSGEKGAWSMERGEEERGRMGEGEKEKTKV
jgi:hypothetical protein